MVERCLSTTFPIGARVIDAANTPKLGLLVPGTLSDYIGRRFANVDTRLAINVIDTYKKRSANLRPLLEAHSRAGVNTDNFWVDVDNVQELYRQLDTLYKLGYLREERVSTYRCHEECLKVEMLAEENFIPQAGRVFGYNSDGVIACKVCAEPLKKLETSELIMTFPADISPITVFPPSLSNDVLDIAKRTSGMRMLVSRRRSTGLSFEINEKQFNIDVDFFWFNYLNTMSVGYSHIFLVGSTHVRRHLTHIAALYQAVNYLNRSAAKVHLVTPFYILPHADLTDYVSGGYLNEQDLNTLRALILTSVNFKRDRVWQAEILREVRDKLPSNLENNEELVEAIVSEDIPNKLKYIFKLLDTRNIRTFLKKSGANRRRIVSGEYDVCGIIL